MIPAPYTYLAVNIACLAVPLLFSFHPKLQFYRQWRYFLLPCLLTALAFLVWDSLFTAMGIWRFNPDYITGIFIGNMPLEEVLFFICIPYACVFSYHCFTLFFHLQRWQQPLRLLLMAAVAFLLLVAFLHLPQLYTSVTFILLALLLVWLLYRRAAYLPVFCLCFLFILIPFLLSNGVLTGSFVNRPVVLYNDDYNLGIRLLTIPVEDMAYGMLLLLLNVAGFEAMKKSTDK